MIGRACESSLCFIRVQSVLLPPELPAFLFSWKISAWSFPTQPEKKWGRSVSSSRLPSVPGLVEKDVTRLRVLGNIWCQPVEFFNSLCIYFLGGKRYTLVHQWALDKQDSLHGKEGQESGSVTLGVRSALAQAWAACSGTDLHSAQQHLPKLSNSTPRIGSTMGNCHLSAFWPFSNVQAVSKGDWGNFIYNNQQLAQMQNSNLA